MPLTEFVRPWAEDDTLVLKVVATLTWGRPQRTKT